MDPRHEAALRASGFYPPINEPGQPPGEDYVAALLRSLRDKIPENPNTGFSALNMLRGGIEHGANTMDTVAGYRDPSQMTALDAPGMAALFSRVPGGGAIPRTSAAIREANPVLTRVQQLEAMALAGIDPPVGSWAHELGNGLLGRSGWERTPIRREEILEALKSRYDTNTGRAWAERGAAGRREAREANIDAHRARFAEGNPGAHENNALLRSGAPGGLPGADMPNALRPDPVFPGSAASGDLPLYPGARTRPPMDPVMPPPASRRGQVYEPPELPPPDPRPARPPRTTMTPDERWDRAFGRIDEGRSVAAGSGRAGDKSLQAILDELGLTGPDARAFAQRLRDRGMKLAVPGAAVGAGALAGGEDDWR
jgi:hypothetical protein